MTLLPHQIDHYAKIQQILKNTYFYIDGSGMGTGKTPVACMLSKQLNLPLIVVAPSSALFTWVNTSKQVGNQIYEDLMLTYEGLTSKRGCIPKHKLLTRTDVDTTTQFTGTEKLKNIIKKGVLFIFDEIQKIKNLNKQNKAIKAIFQVLTDPEIEHRSKVGLLSGTPFDKKEQVINILNVTNILNKKKIYDKYIYNSKHQGVQRLYDIGKILNPEPLDKWIKSHNSKLTKNNGIDYAYYFFIDILKPVVMSIMNQPEMNAIKDIKNGYYKLNETMEIKYKGALENLQNTMNLNSNLMLGHLIKVLIEGQKAKMVDMARIARQELMTNIDNKISKVILFADYNEVIDYLLNELREFKPLELTGRINKNILENNKNLFQQQDGEYRLLIGNYSVGCITHNLHDVTGKFPRTMYIMPNFKINELHQSTGRIYRTGTIGLAKIRFFYGLSGDLERKILTCLSRKGQVMKEILKEQHDNGVKFPDEYENEYEYDN